MLISFIIRAFLLPVHVFTYSFKLTLLNVVLSTCSNDLDLSCGCHIIYIQKAARTYQCMLVITVFKLDNIGTSI